MAGVLVILFLANLRDSSPTAAEADATVVVTTISDQVPNPEPKPPASQQADPSTPDPGATTPLDGEPAIADAGLAEPVLSPPPTEPREPRTTPRPVVTPARVKRGTAQRVQEICHQGNRLILQGKFDEAAVQFNQALELDPGNSDAKRGLAIANDRLDRDPKRLFDQGNRAILKGNYREATKHFEAALRADSSFAEAHRGLGLAYSKLGQNVRATRHYLAYIEIRPHAPDIARVREMIKQLESSGNP
ncbi:MAG: tetratricopeptide repeat protein [Deltaproteobacteria bacterium]|nr:tetratricopeptide repeat protein [Deltaproteobacteria bacterium]